MKRRNIKDMHDAIRRSQCTDDLHKYQLCENDVKQKM